MTPLFRKFLGMNWLLFATMIGLAVFGVFSIYAASGWQDDPALSGKWKDQVIWFSVGIVVHFAAALIDYRWIRWGALPMYLAGIGGLVAVKAFGVELSGAQSWLIVGGQSVQPSQFAMLAGILILAVVLGELPRLHAILRLPFVRLALAGIIVVVPFGMVLKEPDIGSAFVWVPVTAGVFLVGSIPYRYLICIALIGVASCRSPTTSG
ncbi:MAG: FtsW/RodA/SpoVE family cell cycle protein [Verrucomicrobiales bacterium]